MSIKHLCPGDRIYVAGAGGMLGQAVVAVFSEHYEVQATDVDPNNLGRCAVADIADHDDLDRRIREFRPKLLLNLAAKTDLEQCEKSAPEAWRTNTLGAEVGAIVARRHDCMYAFISTAGVFSGDREFYDDYAAPGPLTVYARTKAVAEARIPTLTSDHYIFRAGWMMGGGPQRDKKFINKIYQQLLAGSRQIRAVTDKWGTPTYTWDFARNMLKVLGYGMPGIYNQVCEASVNRFDVARQFISNLGLGKEVQVLPVSSDVFSSEYFAARPASEQLHNFKLDALGLNGMRDWTTCLAEYALEFPRPW